jgi:hypothetical protein
MIQTGRPARGIRWGLILCLGACLWAQGAGTPPASGGSDWVAVPGPHIDRQAFISDGALLQSHDRILQQKALDQLESAIRTGQTSPDDPNILNLIGKASLDFNISRGPPGNPNLPDHPDVRARGLRLLALLGGDGARSLASRIVAAETDPAVLSEGYATLNQTHAVLGAAMVPDLVRHLRDPFGNGPNDGMIQEILRYIQSSQSDGSLASRDLFDALLGVYQNRRYLQQTNVLALRTLKLLMGMN